jgi:hypothetical protein
MSNKVANVRCSDMSILIAQTEFSGRTRANHPIEFLALFLGVFLLFTVVTVIFFWQWIPDLHWALIGPPGDNMQDFWNTWYAAVATSPDHFFFTELIRFPEGTPLHYHSFAYPKVFAIALLSKVVGGDTTILILLQNLSLLVSFPLAGTGTFYLVRYFTANTAGALLGGFLFAFNPSHLEHVMQHAHVSTIEFIPFFLVSYLLTIERKSLLFLLLAIVFYSLNALSCWYYIFYVAYFIAFHTVYVAIRDRILPRGWELLTPIACLAGTIVVLSPILVPMIRTAMSGASVYAEPGGDSMVADVIGYLTFPRFHILASLHDSIYQRLSGLEWENTVYLGWVNIAVLACLCVFARHKDSRLLAYVFCGMAVFCIFASGDSLHVLGHRNIPMPGAALSQLPFFRNVRVPSRAIVFVYMFLAIGIGHAAALAWRYRQRPMAGWGMAAVAALMVLDFFPARRLAMTPVYCSPGLAVVRDDPEKDFGILDLPSGRYFEGNFYMLGQVCHSRPIAQGNTSRDVVVSLRDRLESQDLQTQRRQLVAAKVKYIIIHRPNMELRFGWRLEDGPQVQYPQTYLVNYPWFEWRPEDGPQDQYPQTYPVVYDAPDLTVLRVY